MDRATRIINAKAERAAWTRRQFMAGMGAGAIVAAGMRVRKANALLGIPGGAASSSSTPSGFLPAGHYVTANQPMVVVAPRPVAELSLWSYYAAAYFDGTYQVPNWYPQLVLGGSFPYVFGFVGTPPAGVSLPQPYWIPGYTWAQMAALGYGYVLYTPPLGAGLAIGDVITWTVRCYSQDYQTDSSKYIDLPMSVTLRGAYNSTSGYGYVFMSPSGSNSNVNPTITAPLADFSGVYPATVGASQYPNGILIARAGTYASPTQGGAAVTLEGGVNCACITNYPGEAVSLTLPSSGADAAAMWLGSTATNGSDMFVRGLQFTGTTTATNFWYITAQAGLQNRIVLDSISCPNVFSGTSPGNNASIFYANDPDSSSSTVREYIGITNCSETNRAGGSGFVDASIHVIYKANYCVTQGNSSSGTTSANPPYGITYKAGNSYIEMRCNVAPGLGISAQASDSAPTGSVEVRYNIVSGPSNYAIEFNQQNDSSSSPYPLGAVWSNRNSLIGSYIGGVLNIYYAPASTTTVVSDSDAIEYGSGEAVTVATGITNSNTQCQAASGVFTDSTATVLASPYSSYNGTRGANIE